MADHTANPLNVPFGFCHCGCGRKTNLANKTDSASGRVKGMPMRYLRGHQGRKHTPEYREEDRGFLSPCWIWQRGKMANGYGVLRRPESGKKALLAHRVYFEDASGPIRDGLHIDHLCRNRDCVNPDHLEAVPPAINHRRGVLVKLTQNDVDELRASYPAQTQVALARRFGITERNVWDIVHFRIWKEVA